MKKIKSLVLIVLSAMILFSFAGCNKTPLTVDDFTSQMEEKDYTVSDAISRFSQYDYVKKVKLAVEKDRNYKLEFYELDTEENAKGFFNTNKKIIEDLKDSSSKDTSVSDGNYDKYTLASNDRYGVVSRVGNTVIYLNVKQEYKDTIDEVLSDLNY